MKNSFILNYFRLFFSSFLKVCSYYLLYLTIDFFITHSLPSTVNKPIRCYFIDISLYLHCYFIAPFSARFNLNI